MTRQTRHVTRQPLVGRYPFLLVDKILECVPGEYAVGVKCITSNEPQFTGHRGVNELA